MVKLELSETMCQVVNVCPCTLRFLHSIQKSHEYMAHLKNRDTLQQTSKNEILVSPGRNKCVVLQIQQYNFASYYHKYRFMAEKYQAFYLVFGWCELMFRASDVSGPEIETRITARGALESLLLNTYVSPVSSYCSCLRCTCARASVKFGCPFCDGLKSSHTAAPHKKPFFRSVDFHSRIKGKTQMHNWGWMNVFWLVFRLNSNS